MAKEVKEEVTPKITAEEAVKVLQEENQKKDKAFAKEYEELCKKHKRKIIAQTALRVQPLE